MYLMNFRKKIFLSLCGIVFMLMAGASPVWATVEFSYQTEMSCVYCHEDPEGGGTLTRQGAAFMAADYTLSGDAAPSIFPSLTRLFFGFTHVLAAFIWMGTIFYVHLFMGPRSLSSGLPKAEVLLGRVSMLVMALTGIALTLLRVHSLDTFWTTTFGIVWLIKVGLFLLMVAIAAITTTKLDKMLQKPSEQSTLISDGVGDRPAHVVVSGRLYDVSANKRWAGGVHMKQHRAGHDLTDALLGAPHGADMLERVTDIGPSPHITDEFERPAMKWFVLLAKSALVLGVLILFCVAYWKWGPPLV